MKDQPWVRRKWSWVKCGKGSSPLRLTARSPAPCDDVELHMSVTDAMDIVRALPKLGGAWTEDPERVHSKCFERRDVHGRVVAAVDAFPSSDGGLNCAWKAMVGNKTSWRGVITSLEEAKKLADDALRADGWLLEDFE